MTDSEYRSMYRRMRIESGICHDCGASNNNGKSLCDRCLAKRRAYYYLHKAVYTERQKRYRQRQKACERL